jgi:hypothetical protein
LYFWFPRFLALEWILGKKVDQLDENQVCDELEWFKRQSCSIKCLNEQYSETLVLAKIVTIQYSKAVLRTHVAFLNAHSAKLDLNVHNLNWIVYNQMSLLKCFQEQLESAKVLSFLNHSWINCSCFLIWFLFNFILRLK